jgi:hypothetical protein
MSEQSESGDSGEREAGEASVKRIMEAIGALPPEVRSDIIDDLLETYCSMCAEHLDVEGECPEGCDPEDMLDEEDEDGDDDEGEDGDEDDGEGEEGEDGGSKEETKA